MNYLRFRCQNTLVASRDFKPWHNKAYKMSVRLAKTLICLGIRQVWSESLLCAPWVIRDPTFLHADNEDADHTGLMPRLIWVFTWCTATLLGLSRRGSVRTSSQLTLNAPIATKVVCFSRLPKCLRSLYGKQCGPRSDCSLFASILNSSVMLGNYLQQTTSADDIFRCIFFLGL